MKSTESLLLRLRTLVRKAPSTLRNIVFSKLGVWPVSSLGNSELRHIPVLCISLPRAHAKRRMMTTQVRSLEFASFEFIDAVDATTLDRDELNKQGTIDDALSRIYHERTLTLTEIACSLSHRRAYELIVDRRYEYALVLEDDALFVSRRAKRVSLSDVPAGFDVLFLSSFLIEEPPMGRVRGGVYGPLSYHGSAAAYIVSRAGAEKLLRNSLPVLHAADGLLGRALPAEGRRDETSFRQRGVSFELRAYVSYPDSVLNGSCVHYYRSDVQATKWTNEPAA